MAKKTNVTINGIGYYRLRKTVGKDRDGKPIIKPFYGESKRDAERKYQEWRDSGSLDTNLSAQSLSQAMYTWLWEIEKMSGNKESTFEKDESIYRNYVEKSDFGYRMLIEIDKLSLQKHYNELYAEGKSHHQIFGMNKILSKFFGYCVQEGYIKRNPCAGIKLAAYKKIDDEVRDEGAVETFTEDEIKRILKRVNKNVKLRVLIKFALSTGLRQGELLALRVDDIEDMTVSINKRVKRVKVFTTPKEFVYELQTTSPKTENSVRKVPIPSGLAADLKELELLRKKEKLKIGKAYHDNGLLFPSEVGTTLNARNVLRSWQRLFEDIDVPYKKFHALRHTYATLLLKKGTPLLTVSRLLGHTSMKTTQIYAHVVEESKKSEVEKLNDILSG